MGFEPTPAERNGLAVHRLNHSATSSVKLKSFSLGFIDTYHVNGSVHIIVLWLTKNQKSRSRLIRFAIQFNCINPIVSTHPGQLSRQSTRLLISGSWVRAPRWEYSFSYFLFLSLLFFIFNIFVFPCHVVGIVPTVSNQNRSGEKTKQKNTPNVGLEPTTPRLRVSCSTD